MRLPLDEWLLCIQIHVTEIVHYSVMQMSFSILNYEKDLHEMKSVISLFTISLT